MASAHKLRKEASKIEAQLESLTAAFRSGYTKTMQKMREETATSNIRSPLDKSSPSASCKEYAELAAVLKEERAQIKSLQKQVEELTRMNSTREFNEQQALLSLRAMKHEKVSERRLMVDRFRNSITDATMKTEGILGYIYPGEVYRTLPDNLEQVADEDRMTVQPLVLPEPVVPRMLVIENRFQDKVESDDTCQSNILGGNVSFITRDASYIIPNANETAEEFAYYGAHLVSVGSTVQFQTPQVVPYTKMIIGERYVENYLLNEDFGGGFYIEYHSCPHYHQPLDEKSKGWLILGKFTDDEKHVRLSAFKIPFGYGVYMPPNVLHCDAFLTGNYLVAYTAAKEYKTGVFLTKEKEITSIRIWCKFSQKIWGLEKRRKSFLDEPDRGHHRSGSQASGYNADGGLQENLQHRWHRQNSTEYHNFDMKGLFSASERFDASTHQEDYWNEEGN